MNKPTFQVGDHIAYQSLLGLIPYKIVHILPTGELVGIDLMNPERGKVIISDVKKCCTLGKKWGEPS